MEVCNRKNFKSDLILNHMNKNSNKPSFNNDLELKAAAENVVGDGASDVEKIVSTVGD